MDPQDSPEAFHQQTPNYAGWASFEARVRGRRFSRVVEQARTAIDQGRVDDATAALQEARTLAPDAPEIAELEERLAAPPAWNGELMLREDTPEVDVESDPGWPRLLAGMAVVALLLFSVGFGLVQVMHTSTARELLNARSSTATADVLQTDTPKATPEPAPSMPLQNPDPISAIQKVEKSESPAALPEPTQAQAEVETTPAPSPRSQPTRPTQESTLATAGSTARLDSRRPAAPAPAPTTGWRLRMPTDTSAAPPPPAAPATERPATTDSVPATATAGLQAPVTPAIQQPPVVETVARAESATSLTPVPALDVPVRASRTTPDPDAREAAREEESMRIRALLSRYETAYNRLDAKAASSVWPGVNQAALGRAFDGLLSQRVSLGLCDITVIGDIAGANCAGKARWEPKVGGGLQTADRYWKFNLRKTDDGWKIQEILVR